MTFVEAVSVLLTAACNMTRSVYRLEVTSPAGPRPTRMPVMLACSGVKPSSSLGIPYCCSFPS